MSISAEDFYLHLLDASNTNIFQWGVVILTLSLGLLTILQQLDDSKGDRSHHNLTYTIIYISFSIIIVCSISQIIHIMYLQNSWVNQINNITVRKIFYDSRSPITNNILGYNNSLVYGQEYMDSFRCIVSTFILSIIFVGMIFFLRTFEREWFDQQRTCIRQYLRIPRVGRIHYRRLFQIIFLIFSGWFGEFSYLISLLRVIEDTIRAGYLRSTPYFQYNGLYGLSWRVHFYIGSPVEFVAGIPILLVILWILYEFYRGQDLF
jgi:hypothetical protein